MASRIARLAPGGRIAWHPMVLAAFLFLIPTTSKAVNRDRYDVPLSLLRSIGVRSKGEAAALLWILVVGSLVGAAHLGAPSRRLMRRRSLLAEGTDGPVRAWGVGVIAESPAVDSPACPRSLFFRERVWRYTGNRWQFLGEEWEATRFWLEDRAGAVALAGSECWFVGVRPNRFFNGEPVNAWRAIPKPGDTRVLRWCLEEGQSITASGWYRPSPPSLDRSADGTPVIVVAGTARRRIHKQGFAALLLYGLGIVLAATLARVAF